MDISQILLLFISWQLHIHIPRHVYSISDFFLGQSSHFQLVM